MYYSMLLTGANYLFPLLVYTYVSRVLGVSNIGLVGFVDSVTVYFILFSMMGISVLGVRAIARARGDSRKLTATFWSLLSLHATFTILVLAAMVVATFTVDELRDHRQMMYVGMCKLIFNVFLVEWLFNGLEEFRYIALRTLAVKGLYVVSVFIFVGSSDDTFTYYLLTMLVMAVMAGVNMLHAYRQLDHKKVTLEIKRYVKPFFSLGLYALVSATYATFNMVYLGFAADDSAVGCFSTASKIVTLVGVVFTAYVSVMAPRANRLWVERETRLFRQYAAKSAVVIIIIGLCLGTGVYLLAPQLVEILSGPGYDGAVLPLRLMTPLLTITGLSQMFALQMLVPAGRENRIAFNSACGFIVCLVINILLTHTIQQTGSAMAWMAGETTTMLLSLAAVVKLRQAQ